jgi:PhoPQ-activated pathogenicity-related protein
MFKPCWALCEKPWVEFSDAPEGHVLSAVAPVKVRIAPDGFPLDVVQGVQTDGVMIVTAGVRFGLVLGVALVLALPPARGGALEAYVSAPDTHYAWRSVSTRTTNGFSIFHLELTSQEWRGHTWTHHLQVVRPPTVRNKDVAFLFVTGDGTGTSSIPMLRTLAERAGALAAVVTRVPNQPLYDGRSEDALIAYTFDQFLKTGDQTWPLLFPMVKSAVRAMDTVQSLALKEWDQSVRQFVVSGASKRGWTTWLTAAADPRVVAIAPMVIDMLNMKKQLEWAEKCYGRQSEQIHDYTELNLHLVQDDERVVQLRSWVDPYSYRQRYNLPKLLLLGTNDPYWTVDALRHYWDELPEPKLIYQTPNAGHDLGDRKEAVQTLAAFFEMVADRQPLPKFSWKFKNGQETELAFDISAKPKATRLFTADSPDRDFRNDKWVNRTLEPAAGHSVVHIDSPSQGYRAYLTEVTLTDSTGHDYKLSTEARVVPDSFGQGNKASSP